MPGGTIRASATGGVAANTSFFGPIPDRFTRLAGGHPTGPTTTSFNACFFDKEQARIISDLTIFNLSYGGGANTLTASFGANTTAPDGNNTGVKLVEAATNSQHWCSGATNTDGISGQSTTHRIAIFAKAAERTRFVLTYFAASAFGSAIGCKTVFDVGGGQIGVANTTFGGTPDPTFPWVAGPTTITPWPNGWYLCTMDVIPGLSGGSNAGNILGVYLDSGSGTAAEKIGRAHV